MHRTVLVTDYAWPSLDTEREVLAAADAEIVVAPIGDDDALVALSRNADAILTNWRRVPPAALEVAERCLVVARYGVGVDNIPVRRATELGILVANVPDFCVEEVSDHALALLLSSARRIVPFADASAAGRWEREIGHSMRRLRGQTLGVIGFGAIARALACKGQALGLRVLAHTPRLKTTDIDGVDVTHDLRRLLAESDYVSLHAPATPETRNLIGEEQLRLMKPTAFLINTSRGALVDEAALGHALRERWIAGAALDVLAAEPPSPDHPLLGTPGCLVTPHAAFWSEEAIAELQTRAAENVASVLRGEVPATVVNRNVIGHRRQ